MTTLDRTQDGYNNDKRRGVISVGPGFSVCVDSFIIASINVLVYYSSNEVRVHKVLP